MIKKFKIKNIYIYIWCILPLIIGKRKKLDVNKKLYMKKNQRNEMWTRNSVAWIRKKEDQNLRMKLRKYNELWINYDTSYQAKHLF